MLGKLFKQDMKATGRYVGLIFMATAIATALATVLWAINNIWDNPIYKGISTPFIILLWIMIGCIVFLGTSFIIYFRFYNTMVGEEGYLTHTLPVTIKQLLISKLGTGVVYSIIKVVVLILLVILFIGITVLTNDQLSFDDIRTGINALFSSVSSDVGSVQGGLILFEFGIMALVATIQSILMAFLAIALGQTAKSHKVLASIGMYVLVNIVVQTITQIIAVVIIIFAAISDNISAFEVWVENNLSTYFHIINLTSIVIGLGISTIYYFITKKVFEKKLNLE